jgi:hypothetical protein
MWLVVFFSMMVFAGHRAARALWEGGKGSGIQTRDGGPRTEPPFERARATALLALALALILSWALALPRVLTRGTLLGGGLCIAIGADWLGRRGGESLVRGRPGWGSVIKQRLFALRGREVDAEVATGIVSMLGWVALGGWCIFALWRGATVFSPNHDAVAYHLPKAALLALAHGYQTFDGPDARVSFWPCDYELLLADVILLDGNDVHTAWVSTASLAAFLLAVGALAERWWGPGPHVVLAILLAAGMTVVLLLSDAQKNDLMAAALFVTAIALTARWAMTGEAAPALMAFVSVAIALGTKVSAGFLIGALAPVAGWGAWRQWRRGLRVSLVRLALSGAGALALALLLGCVVFVRNLMHAGRVIPEDPGMPATYDGFANLWRFPLLAFARPFALSADAIWVPWQQTSLHLAGASSHLAGASSQLAGASGGYRHWARHDLFFSEWGLPSSLLLLAVPFGVARYARRVGPGEATPRERGLASLGFLLAFLLFLPIQVPRIGVLATSALCRYTIFLPVVIALWTAVPAVAELSARGGRARLVAAASLFGTGVLFVGYARYEATKDVYEPLDYVLSIAEHPEDRRSRRSGQNFRAAVIVDRIAGPTDEIAFDGAFDAWSYYCFGAALQRKVTYLHPERGLPVTIPASATWVVVDRIANIDFGHPSFRATGDWSFLGRGNPAPEDLAVFEQMQRDPAFKLVYAYEEKNQAIFRRLPRS